MSSSTNRDQRRFTEVDFSRLERFTVGGALPQLEAILNEAEVVPAQSIPADVVTMYSQFVVQDLKTQHRRILVVCYPTDAEPVNGYISVLSPAGMSFIGLAVASVAKGAGSSGEEKVAHVERVRFQPEATGDYLT